MSFHYFLAFRVLVEESNGFVFICEMSFLFCSFQNSLFCVLSALIMLCMGVFLFDPDRVVFCMLPAPG
jgi:hypothetical protein